jgi:hypothetical protein
MKDFRVTYERWDEAALEAGDTDDRGFVIEHATLREAIQLGLEAHEPSWLGACEPSDSRAEHARWLSFYDWNEGTHERYTTGIIEERALHIPARVTPSSRRRIVRLFGRH